MKRLLIFSFVLIFLGLYLKRENLSISYDYDLLSFKSSLGLSYKISSAKYFKYGISCKYNGVVFSPKISVSYNF